MYVESLFLRVQGDDDVWEWRSSLSYKGAMKGMLMQGVEAGSELIFLDESVSLWVDVVRLR